MINAFVILIVCIAAIVFISIFTSLGIIFISLKKTPFVKTTPLLSLTFLPVLLTVGITHMGYLKGDEIILSGWHLIMTVGVMITVLVVLRWRGQIRSLFFAPSIIFSLVSGLVSVIIFAYLNATQPFAFNYLGNGEFFNYAQSADFLIKNEKEIPSFFQLTRSLRFGQDIFLGVLSVLYNKHPVELVHVASGYLFFGYASTIGYLISEMFGINKMSSILMIIHALMLTPLFNFNVSFFSSTVINSSAILVLAYAGAKYTFPNCKPHINQFFKKNIIGNVLLLICFIEFFCITYPEFGLPIIGGVFVLAANSSICCRRVSIPLTTFVITIALLAILNLDILLRCLQVFFDQLNSNGGWNIFGNPLNDSTFFLLNVSGLSHPLVKYSGGHIASNTWATLFILISWIALIYSFLRRGNINSHHQESGALMIWSAVTMYSVIAPFFRGGSWYLAAKIFSQFSVGIIMILGFAFNLKSLNEKKIKPRNVDLGLMTILLTIFFVFNLPQLYLAKKATNVYSYHEWTNQIRNAGRDLPLVVFDTREGELIWFAEIVANNVKIHLKPVTNSQVDRLKRQQEALPIGLDGIPVNYDLSMWPFNEEVLAIVNSHEGSSTKLRSDQGFDFSVTRHEIVASLGNSRLDRINFGDKSDFTFNDWAVNGVWSASIGPFCSNASLTINVPEPLIRAGPVDIIFDLGQKKQVTKVSCPGVHVLSVNAGNGMKYPQIITVRTAETWSPGENDKSSNDIRRLGVQVLALSTTQKL